MSTADKDGRILRAVQDQATCLGIALATYADEVSRRVYRYLPAEEPDPGLLRELFQPTLWWVYAGGRCIGTAEPDPESGGLRIYVLPLLWEGDQA